MSLDLTRAEIMDRVAKSRKRPARTQLILLAVFVVMFAAAFGYVVPTPIHTY